MQKNSWIFSSFFSPAILGVSFCFRPLSQTHEKKKLFNIIMCVCMYSFERCFYCPIIINYNNNNNSEYRARNSLSFVSLEKEKKSPEIF